MQPGRLMPERLGRGDQVHPEPPHREATPVLPRILSRYPGMAKKQTLLQPTDILIKSSYGSSGLLLIVNWTSWLSFAVEAEFMRRTGRPVLADVSSNALS